MIFLIEGNYDLRKLLTYTLNSAGYAVEGFEKPSLFWSACKYQIPSLVVLEDTLPEESGIEIVKKLRNSSKIKNVPVIMVAEKDSEYTKVLALDSGADDCMVKPIGTMEFLARIKATLRRTGAYVMNQGNKGYSIGTLSVDIEKHEVKADGKMIELTFREFELLCLLLENQGKVLTRNQIFKELWNGPFDKKSRTVDVHIRTLRQKLGKYGDYVETIRGLGYKIGEENF